MPDIDAFLAQAAQVERALSAKVELWRAHRTDTRALRQELLGALRDQTFNSLVLMRLYGELLLAERELDEALAVLDTYAVLQAQHLLKQNSGARASPEPLADVVHLFSLVLSSLEDASRVSYARLAKLSDHLDSIVAQYPEPTRATAEFQAQIAGPAARIALLKALHAQDEDTYQKQIAAATGHFAALQADADVRTECARGLFLAITSDPARAFAPVKAALTRDPEDTRCALLLIRLLSAAGQPAEALELAEAYLARVPMGGALVDKIQYVNLKKTHVALLEACRGPEVAFAELAEFIVIVSSLFLPDVERPRASTPRVTARASTNSLAPTPSFMNKLNPLRRAHTNPTKTSRILSFRQRPTTASIASTTATPPRGLSSRQLAAQEARVMAFCWFWIAQQYTRAELVDEARRAVDEALQFLEGDADLAGAARRHALLGQIEHARSPARALRHYKLALDADPTHIMAAIGAATILAASEDADLEFARYLLVTLETICASSPGRFVSEVWFARGKVCELVGGVARAREMYWKTIALEERRAVTSYVFADTMFLC